MDLSSFLTSLITSFVIFIVLTVLFAWLSSKPGNAVVYYPNRLLKGLDPWEGGSRTRNPFTWIREALTSRERDIVKMSGVDTAVYFVFLATAMGILVFSGVVLLPILLPVAGTDEGIKASSSSSGIHFSKLDRISMGNVKERSSRLWAFFVCTYWVSFVTYFMLWRAYKHVAALRANALRSSEVRPEQFAVLVRDLPPIPDGRSRKEQVDSFFKDVYPDTFYRSLVVTDNTKVNKLYDELEGYRKKLAHAEAVFASKPDERPTTRTGPLGLIGKKVDSIDYYNEKIDEITPKWEAEQKLTLREKQQPSTLAFFTSRLTAASAAQSLQAQMVDTWTVMEAPEARQILWANLAIQFYLRQIRQYVVYIIVALTIIFYMIPIAFISAVTTLNNLQRLMPFLKPVVKIGPVKAILEAYLPQLALIIFLALLPKLLLFLSKAEGIPTESHAVRATSGKYFYFIVLNVFIGVTLGGTLFSTFKSLEDDPTSIVSVLANSIPANGMFFLTYVALKFFVGYGLELSRLVPLIIYHLKRKYLCKTEAELKEAWAPGDLGYATRIPGDLLIITIVLCYSVIAPLIIPFGVLYFVLGWLILRNQALKVYVPSFESYGRMWPHLHSRIVASLFLFQVTMLGYFGVKKFYYTPILIMLPILSLIFAYVCRKKFYRSFRHTALEVVCRDLNEIANMDDIFKSYIPPSLFVEKNDEEPFEDAVSQLSRSGSSHA